MTNAPRLTVGLPVFNGERFVSETLDSLLGQSYSNFELLISDNASTDGTEEICRAYAAKDPRIRYIRQPRNIGCNPNHNFLVSQAKTEYFKWAAHDDLYGRDLLARCVTVLDENPDVVLSHGDKAVIDEDGNIVELFDYDLATDSENVVERFRSLVVADGADDEYGVIRTHVLRNIRPKDSYHHAARPLMAEIAFRGRFHQVRELLYFRRDHLGRGDRHPTIPTLCTNLDPQRAGQGTTRLVAEYAYRFFEAVARAPIKRTEKLACYGVLASHLTRSGLHRAATRSGDPLLPAPGSRVDASKVARYRTEGGMTS